MSLSAPLDHGAQHSKPAHSDPAHSDLARSSEPHILCYYSNQSSRIEVLRIASIPHWYFEKVVFPSERLFFEAPATAELEVYSIQKPGNLTTRYVSCQQLQAK